MPRGRPPKPVSVLRLQGTYDASRHKRRAVEPEAVGELAALRPPKWMTRRQKQIWAEILKRAPHGVLRQIAFEMFSQYVELVDRHERAVIAQAGLDAKSPMALLVKGAAGATMSPYLRIIDRSILLMTRLQSEMGFTRVARARLGQPQAPREPTGDDSWAVLRRFPVIAGGKANEGPATSPGRRKNGKKA